jgi:hypothetical protein
MSSKEQAMQYGNEHFGTEKHVKNADDSDDDVPQLSVEALRALQEFYAESESNCAKIDEDWVKFKKIFNLFFS